MEIPKPQSDDVTVHNDYLKLQQRLGLAAEAP